MSLTAVVKMSIGVSQWSRPGRALSCCQAPPAALSRREQPPLSPHPPKCQHITLLIRDHQFAGARERTHSIIRIMIILIRWGAAPRGKGCTINYTLPF